LYRPPETKDPGLPRVFFTLQVVALAIWGLSPKAHAAASPAYPPHVNRLRCSMAAFSRPPAMTNRPYPDSSLWPRCRHMGAFLHACKNFGVSYTDTAPMYDPLHEYGVHVRHISAKRPPNSYMEAISVLEIRFFLHGEEIHRPSVCCSRAYVVSGGFAYRRPNDILVISITCLCD